MSLSQSGALGGTAISGRKTNPPPKVTPKVRTSIVPSSCGRAAERIRPGFQCRKRGGCLLIKFLFQMDNQSDTSGSRRAFFKTATAAALTTNIFTGNLRGANDRVAVGFIGLGTMGSGNLGYAMKVPEAQPAALCDVYQPHLERAEAAALKGGYQIKGVKDFREILANKSIDAVCISTPDHWHAYMAVEACKAGKDVYVEKPACVYIDEGPKMIAAARKYNRIVQAGTMQRSGGYFKKAAELVASGAAGEITFCHTFQSGTSKQEGYGNPKDSDPPSDLNWEMWLGPAPKVAFNANRWGVKAATFPTFRY